MVGWLANNEFDRMLKEVSMAYLEKLYQHLLCKIEENGKFPSQVSWSMGQNFKWGSPTQQALLLHTQVRHLVP
jgi:hypothetical protein